MAEVHFLEHYRYRRFIRTIKEAGCFPTCPYHQLSIERILEFFNYLWQERCTFQKILDLWKSLSLFVSFYYQQPVQMPLEMMTPYDFSRFINFYVPIFHPEIKTDPEEAEEIFDGLYHFFLFLHQTNDIQTLEPIAVAKEQIFKNGKICSIHRRKLRGPEWAVVIHSPVDGSQQVFTFNDLWMLVVLQHRFHAMQSRFRAYLEKTGVPIRDRLKKRAHFSRLMKRLRSHHISHDQVIKGLDGKKMTERARKWLESDEFLTSLLNR